LHAADHFVQFFDSDVQLVDAVGGFIERGIVADEACVVIVTKAHREAISAMLRSRNLDVTALERAYRFIVVDAEAMLDELVSDGRFDARRFHARADMLVRLAASRGQAVRVAGELVGLLTERGMPDAAIELEELWNELGRFHNFVLFCAYGRDAVMSGGGKDLLERIRAVHEYAEHTH
jgi:hypothetical protein